MNMPQEVCPNCEGTNIQIEFVDLVAPFDLGGITLMNVEKKICGDCGNESVKFPRHQLITETIRECLSMIGRALDGKEFSFLRNSLCLSQVELADILGMTNVNISRWENGSSPVNAQADLILKFLTLEDIGSPCSMQQLIKFRREGDTQCEIDVRQLVSHHVAFDFGPVNSESGHAWEYAFQEVA